MTRELAGPVGFDLDLTLIDSQPAIMALGMPGEGPASTCSPHRLTGPSPGDQGPWGPGRAAGHAGVTVTAEPRRGSAAMTAQAPMRHHPLPHPPPPRTRRSRDGPRPAVDFSQRPMLVFWETTGACLLACRHCRASATTQPPPGELSHDEGRALIDQVAGFGRPYPILVFTGGDCLLRPDLFDLAG